VGQVINFKGETKMDNCQRCGSKRVLGYSAKADDRQSWILGEADGEGYLPGDFNIGAGDYIEFDFCMDCGQIQGQFPLPETEFEETNKEKAAE